MRRWSVIALVLTGCLALAPAGEAKRKHRCAIRDGVVVLHDKKAVILARDAEEGTDYYGCLRSKRRPFYIASSSRSQYGSTSIGPTLLRGVYFSYATASGDINNDCRASVNVVSIRTRVAGYATAALGDGKFGTCPGVSTMVATATGSVAWTSAQGADRFVRKIDPAGQATLDQGPGVDLASLTLVGHALIWTNAGETRTGELR
jgi:hypothetical protein